MFEKRERRDGIILSLRWLLRIGNQFSENIRSDPAYPFGTREDGIFESEIKRRLHSLEYILVRLFPEFMRGQPGIYIIPTHSWTYIIIIILRSELDDFITSMFYSLFLAGGYFDSVFELELDDEDDTVSYIADGLSLAFMY